MAPSVPERDIIISIHPQHVANIANRSKNHEFRSYLIPPTVKRLWIYETSPASSLRYVATISHGKRPGEICDPTGLLNDEFDRNGLEGRAKYGYEILKLEELPTPYTLNDLKEKGWLNGAPQKYCFVKPSMDAALGAVTMHVLFDTASAVEHEKEDPVDTAETKVAEEEVTAPSRQDAPVKPPKQTPSGIRKSTRRKAINPGKQASLEQWLSM